MVGPPRFHGELGAKRVEVTAQRKANSEGWEWVWKRGQQQHVWFTRARMNQVPTLQSRRCSREERPGLASHSRKAEIRCQRSDVSNRNSSDVWFLMS